jgi:hypothetical protein
MNVLLNFELNSSIELYYCCLHLMWIPQAITLMNSKELLRKKQTF